ncbi:MAG: hypothetical protein LBO20_11290 [Bifidobacteriaceae bacterium]|nr:hypothetical protein [Bifidobacteriaceae bacterium]
MDCREPLLFVGQNFTHTDITPAWNPPAPAAPALKTAPGAGAADGALAGVETAVEDETKLMTVGGPSPRT